VTHFYIDGVSMQNEHVLYNGRMVSTEGFRVYVYGNDNTSKIVNSWIEFQEHIASGLWFPTKEAIPDYVKHKKKGDRNGRDS